MTTTFGRYEVLARLGQGGMGEVFLARGQGEKAAVVLKRVLPTLLQDADMLAAFLDETRIAARLRHPNIVRIDELGEVNGEWFVRMEYVEGASLSQLLRTAGRQKEQLPLEFVLTVISGVAAALDHAWTAPDASGRPLQVVHRDVTPQNILLGRKGVVKLIDFGVARAAQLAGRTTPGVLKGKLGYMAPEQIRNERLDARTDLFALGVCMWEALTLRRLFTGESEPAVLTRVLAGDVAPPSLYRDTIPPEVDALVLKALASNPDDRFSRGAELVEAIATLVDQLDLKQGPTVIAPVVRGLLPDAGHVVGLEASEEPTRTGIGERPTPVAKFEGFPLDTAEPGATHFDDGEAERGGIPGDATPLLGRAANLADLHQLLGAHQLVTLHGPLGVGKSRLGREVARQRLSQHKGRVWWVELGQADRLDVACALIASAMGVPLPPGAPIDGVGKLLAGRPGGLLGLDGVEAVVDALRPALTAWLAHEVTVLVCSRQELGLPQEEVCELEPLSTVATDDQPSAAEALFLARAGSGSFPQGPWARDAVRQLVRRLDGLPLAIELAATVGVDSGTPLGSLHDVLSAASVQPALQGVESAFAASWDLLPEADRVALASCCAFAAGFTADAALAVLEPGGAKDRRERALQQLHRLRARSLLRVTWPSGGPPRYGLYESVRALVMAKLPDQVEAARERHAKYFVTFGERLQPEAERGGAELLDLLATERENLFAAWQWLVTRDANRAASLVLALDALMVIRGPYGGQLELLERTQRALVVGAPVALVLRETRARVLLSLGRGAEAEAELEGVLSSGPAPGDEGRALAYLGSALKQQSRPAEAKAMFEKALVVLRRVKDERMAGRVCMNLGALAQEEGRAEDARDLYAEALTLHARSGDRRFEGVTLTNLGVLQQSVGEWAEAEASLSRALALHRELGNQRSESMCLTNLADLERDRGANSKALALYRRAIGFNAAVGNQRFVGVCLLNAALLHLEGGSVEVGLKLLDDALRRFADADPRFEALTLAAGGAAKAWRGGIAEAERAFEKARRALGERSGTLAETIDTWELQVLLARSDETAKQGDTQAAERLRAQALERLGTALASGQRNEHTRMALRVLKAWGAAGEESVSGKKSTLRPR